MKRYLPGIKKYCWVVLACTVIATLIGLRLTKSLGDVYDVSSTIYVSTGAIGDSTLPTLSPNDGIGLAADYASEITTRAVMQAVYQLNPEINKLGYSVDDLLADITTSSLATASTVTIVATTSSANDSVVLANAVATGFQAYDMAQNQQKLQALRTSLQNQLSAYEKQKVADEASLESVASNTDPHFAVYEAELNDTIHDIDNVQAQLVTLPSTASTYVAILQLATAADAKPAVSTHLILAATAGIGLVLGILVIALLIFLDDRVGSEEEVKRRLGLAYLGGLPKSGKWADYPVNPQEMIARRLTDICSNLRLTGVLPGQWAAPRGSALLVTSVRSTEGKSTVAAALAVTMAQSGHKTLVVDAQLDQPALHLALGVKPTGAGLNGLLMAMGTLDDAILRTAIPGVWMLPGGPPIPQASLLLGKNFPTLMEQFRRKADVIIIDGPALLSGAEATVLANAVDGVMLVVDFRRTRFRWLLRAKEIVRSLAPHTDVGVVLNYLPGGGKASYYASAFPGNEDETYKDSPLEIKAGFPVVDQKLLAEGKQPNTNGVTRRKQFAYTVEQE